MPIRKVGKVWKIDRTKGSSPTKKKALDRLRAIKANQKKRGKK